MKYKSDAYEATHLGAVSLYETGVISAEEMKEFDEDCLVQEDETQKAAEKPLIMEHAAAQL